MPEVVEVETPPVLLETAPVEDDVDTSPVEDEIEPVDEVEVTPPVEVVDEIVPLDVELSISMSILICI